MADTEEKRGVAGAAAGGARGDSGATRNDAGHKNQHQGQGRTSRKQQDRKQAPTQQQPQPRHSNGVKGGKKSEADQSEPVFSQLWNYLKGGASAHYVAFLADRLGKMAKERRFRVYFKHLPAEASDGKVEEMLRQEWSDEAPPWRQEKYIGLRSTWDMDRGENEEMLTTLLFGWMITQKLHQRESEDRVQFMNFMTSRKEKDAATGKTVHSGSYKDAIQGGGKRGQDQDLSAEQLRLRNLCMQHYPPLTELRERTTDETKAIEMLLNYEFEVPHVPEFLQQSMKASEIACFTDILMALEYPLFAHLVPGHRFFDDMSKNALLNLIYAGEEAAPAQKFEIELFKANLARIAVDMQSRLLTVTFKGKKTAAKWVGWQVPLASRLVTLVDYETKREHARITNELVLLDYYSFTVEPRKGTVTSKDMFWVMDTIIGLEVQGITHPTTDGGGVNEQQWVVRVKSDGCPTQLKNVYYIMIDAIELVVHHHTVHLNWPCRNCRAASHFAKWCKVPAEEAQAAQKEITKMLKGTLPSKVTKASRGYCSTGQ